MIRHLPGNADERARDAHRLDGLLLEALLGEGAAREAARARLASTPGGAREMHALERHLARSRAELASAPGWSAAHERALVERVLERTTRAPRPARARARWLAAAVATAAATSAAAWLAVSALRERAHDAWPSAGPAFPTAPFQVADLRPDGALRDVLALARAELATTAAAARPESLAPASLAPEASGLEAPLALRLLEARAKGLRERRWEPWLMELSLPDLDPLTLALWCEVELDRFVLTGERPPAWRRAADILARALEHADHAKESTTLLAHALARARGYGLTPAAEIQVAAVARTDALWTGEWFNELEAAGREAGLADSGQWRAWVAWRGR